jgi:F0F1-type ATP synthase membrane subunit b/b'
MSDVGAIAEETAAAIVEQLIGAKVDKKVTFRRPSAAR